MSEIIKRATCVLIIEVDKSNPNGDPNCEGAPRQLPDGRGLISGVSYKRKMRDSIEDSSSPFCKEIMERLELNPEEFKILESRGRDRSKIKEELGKKFNQDTFLKSEFVKKYWDSRLFGNTFLEPLLDKGFIKSGAVQFSNCTSICPIQIERATITNKAGVQKELDQGMAPLGICFVIHGVYVMVIDINPNNAYKSGCTSKDIALFKALIPYVYEVTRSTSRPDVRIRHAWYMEHKSVLGFRQDLLVNALTPKRIGNPLTPSTSWDDYEVPTELPTELREKLDSFEDLVENAFGPYRT